MMRSASAAIPDSIHSNGQHSAKRKLSLWPNKTLLAGGRGWWRPRRACFEPELHFDGEAPFGKLGCAQAWPWPCQ